MGKIKEQLNKFQWYEVTGLLLGTTIGIGMIWMMVDNLRSLV